jgi:protein transport protein SEC24
LINHVNSLSVEQTNAFLYPRCFVLNEDDQSDSHNQAFRQVRAAGEKIRQDQAYLLENGVAMFMWLGSQLDPTWLNEVFGVATLAQIDVDKVLLTFSNFHSLSI